MAEKSEKLNYDSMLRRILIGLLIVFLFAVFLIWYIDNPRVERLRMVILDEFVSNTKWASVPLGHGIRILRNFKSHKELYEENQELRYELGKIKIWREAVIQLEQENARLMRLNELQKGPSMPHIAGVVLADSGSQFRHSVLINLGAEDGMKEGWPAVDGIGVVGRIVGVGRTVSRVMLLTDPASRIPVVLQPTGERALLIGNGSPAPALNFIERRKDIRLRDRVITSGEGGIFPAKLLVGNVIRNAEGELRVALAADYRDLDFLSILPIKGIEVLNHPSQLLGEKSVSESKK